MNDTRRYEITRRTQASIIRFNQFTLHWTLRSCFQIATIRKLITWTVGCLTHLYKKYGMFYQLLQHGRVKRWNFSNSSAVYGFNACRQCLLPNQRDALPGSMTFKFYLSCGRRFRLITDRNHSITIPIASRYVPSPSCLPVCEIEREFRFFAIFKGWITASASRSWRRGTRKRRRRWWRW